MRIDIHDNVSVEDGANFRTFSVRSPLALDEIGARLGEAGAGYLDGDAAWISVSWLRARLTNVGIDATGAGLDGMLAFARSRDWVDTAGTHVRAHIAAN